MRWHLKTISTISLTLLQPCLPVVSTNISGRSLDIWLSFVTIKQLFPCWTYYLWHIAAQIHVHESWAFLFYLSYGLCEDPMAYRFYVYVPSLRALHYWCSFAFFITCLIGRNVFVHSLKDVMHYIHPIFKKYILM